MYGYGYPTIDQNGNIDGLTFFGKKKCHLQHKLIGFYNRDEKCLQRGANWVFK
jgi:hypothetical protein